VSWNIEKFNISYTAIFATTITRQSKFESYTLWQYCNIDEYIFFSLSLAPARGCIPVHITHCIV